MKGIRILRTTTGFLVAAALAACGSGSGDVFRVPGGFRPSFPLSDARMGSNPPGAISEINPKVGCDGDTVYVVWLEQRVSPVTQLSIRFCRSTDGGVSWPATSVNLSPTAPQSVQLTSPMLACDGPRVYVVWTDSRSGAANLYFNRSLDGGVTWLASDVRIGPNPGFMLTWQPEICGSGLNVYVAWLDRRRNPPQEDVFFNRSLDGGLTWLPADIRINDGVGGTANNTFFSLCSDGTRVGVAWTDYRNGDADVYMDTSADGGATWLPADARVDHAAAGVAAMFPEIACSSASVVVVWSDRRSGPLAHPYQNRSPDAGATWRSTDLQLDASLPAADAFAGQVLARGSTVFTSFVNDGRIYFSRSPDAGDTWTPAVRIDREPGNAKAAFGPVLRFNGNNVVVVWQDRRNGSQDLYFTYSVDDGTTWGTIDTRLDTDAPGASDSWLPDVAVTATRVYCVWYDYRNGQPNVYFIGS